MNAYSKNAQGHYLSANPEFIAFTHLNDIDALLGKTDLEMPWGCNALRIMGNDAQVIATGVSQVFIEEALIQGKRYYRRCFKSPLLGNAGKILGISGVSVPVDPNIFIPLTPQQTACLKELALGFGIKKIGKNLRLSPRTVEHYLDSVKMKLNCKSRTELIVQAVMRGLISG